MTPRPTHPPRPLAGRMTTQSTANQTNKEKPKEKEEQHDAAPEVDLKSGGHCSGHNLLLGLTVLGTSREVRRPPGPLLVHASPGTGGGGGSQLSDFRGFTLSLEY